MQNPILTSLIVGLVFLAIGVVIGYIYRKTATEGKINNAEELASRILLDAEREAETNKRNLLLEAKDEIHKLRDQASAENQVRRSELQQMEKRLLNKEDILDKKSLSLERREVQMQEQQEKINAKEKQADDLVEARVSELEKVASLTQEEGKQMLLGELEQELDQEAALLIRENEARVRNESDKIAQSIIVHSIQRLAADQVAENTVSVVNLPSEEMKGRIIGREGRNIRSFESLTGVDLIIDDTPEAVVLSCFDPIRREIARVALEKLVRDGRIHPTRIEEAVARAEREVDQVIKESGEQAAYDAGVHGVHHELIHYLGRLKFRTSYGQNVLRHAVEVSRIAGYLAQEVGANEKMARRAGLLHDLGKSVDHEVEGSHVQLGVDLARRYKEPEEVINGIEAHHGDVEFKYIESILVQAADAISAARPGARRETVESYVKRLEQLEDIANSFDGVEKSYAVQAGREMRIIVQPESISEAEITTTARKIAKEIEQQLDFPGQIKVNVIRETRAVEYAK
ncbi:MAG: ribonuclease Y [Tissierellia bacterium]|nr:ribonuclease Y [Tissierellia bacterium]